MRKTQRMVTLGCLVERCAGVKNRKWPGAAFDCAKNGWDRLDAPRGAHKRLLRHRLRFEVLLADGNGDFVGERLA